MLTLLLKKKKLLHLLDYLSLKIVARKKLKKKNLFILRNAPSRFSWEKARQMPPKMALEH